jgi:hypothetical protein
MTEHYSLHKIYSGTEFPFSPADYSKFKFGDKNVSRKFGFALATGFIKEHLSVHPIENQIVVVSSPYDFIPTATFAMKNYFVQKLNEYLVEKGLPVVQETKIHRTVTYKEDYGALSAEQRLKLISNDSFHMDFHFVNGKTVIYMDDIKITGSHEKVVRKMLGENNHEISTDKVFVYFAELANPKVDPTVENTLNYYFVKDLYSLDKVLKNEDWIPNTRVVKYILKESNGEHFDIFLQLQPLKIMQTIYHLAIGNSYHTMDEYKNNIGKVRKLLVQNKLL